MKKLICIVTIMAAGLLVPARASAQAQEIAQLLLNLEKLSQFKQILSDLKKGYDIVFKGYTTIKNLTEGNFNLHDAFLSDLLKVSPTVRNYYKVAGIADMQIRLVKEYNSAYKRFAAGNRFSPEELDYMARVYANLLKQSLRNLDELLTVITDKELRASDDERLRSIDNIYAQVEDKLLFLRHFNGNASVLDGQRAKAVNASKAMSELHGLDQ